MTNRDLARGGFRAWGVVWLVYALASLPQLALMLAMKGYPPDDPQLQQYALWAQVIGPLTTAAIGGLLIWSAGWIAERIFPLEQEFQASLDGAALQAILFSVIGVYLLVDGFQGALGSAIPLFRKPAGDTRRNLEYVWQEGRDGLIKGLFELVLGLALFFGARGLTGIWRRYRDAGAPASSEEPSAGGPADVE